MSTRDRSSEARPSRADARTKRELVRKAIEDAGERGMTCDDVEVAIGMRHQTASPAITKLVDDGLIVDSGHVRNTRSGRRATVWTVVFGKIAGSLPLPASPLPPVGPPHRR